MRLYQEHCLPAVPGKLLLLNSYLVLSTRVDLSRTLDTCICISSDCLCSISFFASESEPGEEETALLPLCPSTATGWEPSVFVSTVNRGQETEGVVSP